MPKKTQSIPVPAPKSKPMTREQLLGSLEGDIAKFVGEAPLELADAISKYTQGIAKDPMYAIAWNTESLIEKQVVAQAARTLDNYLKLWREDKNDLQAKFPTIAHVVLEHFNELQQEALRLAESGGNSSGTYHRAVDVSKMRATANLVRSFGFARYSSLVYDARRALEAPTEAMASLGAQ
jgi:hypothetical protein